MKTNIIVKLQIEGFHNWSDAVKKMPAMDFLANKHRHIFHITCKKQVRHDDRDIEIINLKRQIQAWLLFEYGITQHSGLQETYKVNNFCDFGPMSCETIAKQIADEFDLCYIEVLEDGENGAEIII